MFKFIKFLGRIICKIFVFVSAEGTDNILTEGPMILAANHESWFDVVSITLYAKRKIHWMAKAKLFKVPLISFFLRSLGGYPVKRDNHDTQAVTTTIDLLKKGEPVGIFIQGTRSRGKGREVKAKHGVAKFAVKTDCPIIPVSVVGKAGFFRKVKIIFGEPIRIPQDNYTNEQYLEISQKILDDIYDTAESVQKNGNNKG